MSCLSLTNFSGALLSSATCWSLRSSSLIIGALAGFILWKFVGRQKFLRELRIGRITAVELKEKIDAGEEMVIVDLRHSMDFEADPETIPGALHMDAKELEERTERRPRDREVILYCT